MFTNSEEKKGKIILLFGRAGLGKSTLAHNCPLQQAHIELEDTGMEGRNHKRVTLDMIRKHWSDLGGNFPAAINSLALKAKEDGAEVIVLDTIGQLDELITNWILRMNGWKSLEDPGFGKGHQLLREEMMKVTRSIIDIAQVHKLHVIALAHTQVESLVEFDGSVREVMSPKFGSVKADKAPYRETLIGNCYIVGQVRQQVFGAKDGRQSGGQIVVDMGSSPGSISKCRQNGINKVIQIDMTGKAFWDVITPILKGV